MNTILSKLKISENKDKIIEILTSEEETSEEIVGGSIMEHAAKISERKNCIERVSGCIVTSKNDLKNKIVEDLASELTSKEYYERIVEGMIFSLKRLRIKNIENNCHSYILKKYYYDLIEDYTKDSNNSIINKIKSLYIIIL